MPPYARDFEVRAEAAIPEPNNPGLLGLLMGSC